MVCRQEFVARAERWVSVLQRDLWTESGLRNNYRRIDAAEAKKHWEFWFKWTEANCTHGYTCSKCAVLARAVRSLTSLLRCA